MSGVVAVGMFDGMHAGHEALIRRAVARAAGEQCIAVSFDPHPDIVLAKEFRAVAPLTPFLEKRERLARLGAELHVLPFTRELASLSPEAFVDEHLVGPFHPQVLVVGEDFALGKGRAGNVERLRAIGFERGFELEAVPLLRSGGAPVTSTRIRDLLAAGQVAEAATLLGRRYVLRGRVVHGEAIGRTLGFPTANLRLPEEKCVPAHGIYAVWARIGDEPDWHKAAMSIGLRPTFGGQVRALEVHLIDWSGDLYDREVTVQFVDWLRGELKFEGAAELIVAIRNDVELSRRLLANIPPEENKGLQTAD